jgi:predicted Zn finger-like uncharacterized protein
MSLATRCTACGTIFRVVQDQLKVSEGWVRCGRCEEVFNALEGLFDLEREAPPRRPSGPPAPLGQRPEDEGEFVASEAPDAPFGTDAPLPSTDEKDAIESRFLARPSADERVDASAEDAEVEHPEFADARFPSELPLDAAVEPGVGDAAEPALAPAAAAAPDPAAVPPRAPLMQRWRESRAARRAALAAADAADTREPPSAPDLRAPGAAPAADSTVQIDLPPEQLAQRPGPMAVQPPSGATPQFVRAADDAARWRRPRVRASLAVAALLLAGLLLEQVAVQFRDAFAVQWPQSRPLLEALCEVHDCRIEPLRRLAALSVESSGLTQGEAADSYRLSLTLNNRAAFPVAAPSVELSLTDASGAVLSRRAFAPSDFRGADGQSRVPADVPLAAGADSQWQLRLAAPGLRVSGYTVELFYP